MILGPACSIANEVMGEIAGKHLNITQVRLAYKSHPYTGNYRLYAFYIFMP